MTHKQTNQQYQEYKVEYDNWRGDYCIDRFNAANDGQAIQLARSYGNVHKVTRDHGRITIYTGR